MKKNFGNVNVSRVEDTTDLIPKKWKKHPFTPIRAYLGYYFTPSNYGL
jgi:hypothetical protein